MRFTSWRILKVGVAACFLAAPAFADCKLSNGQYTEDGDAGAFRIDLACDGNEGDVIVGLTLFEHPDAFMHDGNAALAVEVPAEIDITDNSEGVVDLEPKTLTATTKTLTFEANPADLGVTRYMVFAVWSETAKSDCSSYSDFGRKGCKDFGFTLGGDSMEWDDHLLAAFPGKNDAIYDEETDLITRRESWKTARFR